MAESGSRRGPRWWWRRWSEPRTSATREEDEFSAVSKLNLASSDSSESWKPILYEVKVIETSNHKLIYECSGQNPKRYPWQHWWTILSTRSRRLTRTTTRCRVRQRSRCWPHHRQSRDVPQLPRLQTQRRYFSLNTIMKYILFRVVQGLDWGSKRSFIPFILEWTEGLAHLLMEWNFWMRSGRFLIFSSNPFIHPHIAYIKAVTIV